jgi:hypothetical protein
LRRLIIGSVAGALVRHPYLVLGVLVALGALSLYSMTKLEIESDQIKLISQDLLPVKELKVISEMIGGTGFLMVAIKADDEARLKAVADWFADEETGKLRKLEGVRYITYKIDTTFIRGHIAYFLEPDELEVVRQYAPYLLKGIGREIKKASDPLYTDFYKATKKETALKQRLDDIVEKYRAMGKKGIDDDYYISRDKQMILLLVKPQSEATDLPATRALLDRIEGLFADFNASEDARRIGVRLEQGYAFDPLPAKDGRTTVSYGYTGGYKLNLDDSETIKESLRPTSIISAIGIITVLFIFLRRVSLVLVLIFGLGLGVLYTFGFAYIAVGKLNVITAMLGGILSGLGIDYGIHFLYRLREEHGRTGDLETAIHETIVHSGSAAATSAATTAGAFLCLLICRFRGFKDFGLLAGGGLLIVAVTLYLVIPLIFLVLARLRPSLVERILRQPAHAFDRVYGATEGGRLPGARLVALACVALAVGAGFVMQRVEFDYDSRSLLVPDRASIKLQGEINERFKISSDPVAFRTSTLEEAHRLYAAICGDRATSLPKDRSLAGAKDGEKKKERFATVDGVISIFSFLPPPASQKKNEVIIAQIRKENEKALAELEADLAILPEDKRKTVELALAALDAKPFALEDMPAYYVQQFQARPESKTKGWITFIYPIVSLWDGRDLFRFADEVGKIHVKGGDVLPAEAPVDWEVESRDGPGAGIPTNASAPAGGATPKDEQVFYSTGMAIVYSYLARIVMEDGWRCVALTAVLILIIVFIDFRSLSGALLALVPLLGGMAWMLGCMPLLGTKVNFMNIVIFPLILGYGINNGVYLYHRFRESGSAAVAVRHSSGPIAASMLTTIAGFAALLYPAHRGLRSMGMLACIGLGTSLLVALTFMPALLQIVADLRARRARDRARAGDA